MGRVSLLLLLLSVWLCCCAGLLRAQVASHEWLQFEQFLVAYSKPYQNRSDIALTKFSAFKQSLARHQQLNAYEESHGGTARYGVNKFSDLTPEEFKSLYMSGVQRTKPAGLSASPRLVRALKDPLQKFDWRDRSPPVIGRIRNQERCGSCWAFAVVETISSAFAIEHNTTLLELSPQQLISCVYDANLGLLGCKGGVLESAFVYLNAKKLVVVSEKSYPFASKDGHDHPCKSPLPHKGLVLDDFMYKDNVNESYMRTLLTTVSPLTTSINAITWQDYIGGIIQHHCSGATIDHAVQVVGYDLTGDVPYWTVRNTWGTSWGEHGYIRIKFGANMCGIADEVAAVIKVSSV